jgi:rRNA maturation RNase YbeY
LAIHFTTESIDFQLDRQVFYKKWLEGAIRRENKRLGEIRYWFVSQKRILEINQEYLQHNYLTDIISFDNSFNNELSGDIFICIDVVKTNALEHSESNFEKELARVMIHGILHFCAYRDDTEEHRKLMRSKEDTYLQYLGNIS